MNSRERVLATLRHGCADRVPVAEMWIDPRVVRSILPGASDANDLAGHLGLDMVTVPTMIYDGDEVEWVDRAGGLFRDRWGALQHLTGEAIAVPTRPPVIESEDDLARYTPPDAAASPVIEKVRRLRARHPDKAVAVVGESAWAPAAYLRGGIENLFLDLALRPGFAADLLDIGAAYYGALYPLAVEAGADVVFLGDDYADKTGTMISPGTYEELVLPRDAAVVASIRSAGACCVKHSDGDFRRIMDPIVGTGIEALGPLEDLPGMEPVRVFERYPGRIAVMGNLSVDLLSRGTEEEVVAATKRLLREVSARGPHILSSANTIASSVRPQNYLALVRTVRELGALPITGS